MENKKFWKGAIEEIKGCLQDYANDFMALNMLLTGVSIESVRDQIRSGYKILTVEEYLEKIKKERREVISLKNQKDPLFIEKAKALNKLANQINSLGESINEQILLEIIKDVKKIIYF